MFYATARDEVARTGLEASDVAAAKAFREKALKEREGQAQQGASKSQQQGVKARDTLGEGENEYADDEVEVDERTPFLKQRKQSSKALAEHDAKARAVSIDPLAPSSAFDETLRDRLRVDAERRRAREQAAEEEDEEEDEAQVGPSQRAMRESERLLERNWRAPPGKKIAVPVRIEPKVYFATERTFLVRVAMLQKFLPWADVLRFQRNGSILPSISGPSQPRCLTSYPRRIPSDSSAQGSSPSPRSPPSPTQPSSSSTARIASGIVSRRACITTSTVRRCSRSCYSLLLESTSGCGLGKWLRLELER